MNVCTSIKRVSQIDENTDILLVEIDNDVSAYMIYKYSECLKFLNQEVIVSYRKDIYEGKIETFINTLTIPTRVTTLDREDDVKLFCDVDDNNSNVCFADIQKGETVVGAIMYCIKCEYESYRKVWMKVTVRDKRGRVSHVRLFDYTKDDIFYNGMYIRADIKKGKVGFTTDMIQPMELDYPPNPEIDLAYNYIQRYFDKDKYMFDMLNKTQLLEHMKVFITLERGYELVRLAVQLDILKGLKNSCDDVDYTALSYAIVLQYGYITKMKLSRYSPTLRTITFALQQQLPTEVASTVLEILDTGDGVEKVIPEKELFDRIIELSNTVVKIKKEE